MITIELHPSFRKAFKKRIASDKNLVRKVGERINQFQNNPSHPLLQDHRLVGKKDGLRAFSITGDIRIIYQTRSEDRVIFLDIGTHNQVY